MDQDLKKSKRTKLLLKKCHVCSYVNESSKELEKCKKCKKSFLPSGYFTKIHSPKSKLKDLFNDAEDLSEESLIKGIYVIW